MPVRAWWRSSSALTRSVIVGLALAFMGILLVIVSVPLTDRPTLQAVLANLGTATFTASVVAILYEGFVREGLLDLVRRQIGMTDKIVEQGLSELALANAVSYEEILKGSKTLILLPTDPVDWFVRCQPWLHTLASNQRLQVEVYLPRAEIYSGVRKLLAPEGEGAAVTSAAQLASRQREAVASWRRELQEYHGGSLRIFQYDSYPHRGVIVGDDCVIILTPSPDSPGHDVYGLACVFQGRRAADRVKKERSSIQGLPNASEVEYVGPPIAAHRPNPILPVSNSTEEAPIDPANS